MDSTVRPAYTLYDQKHLQLLFSVTMAANQQATLMKAENLTELSSD
ncbi:hypothetical protein [Algoriphagus sp.]